MRDLTIGNWFTVESKLRRIKGCKGERTWVDEPLPKTIVMLVGQRTLANGKAHCSYGYGDDYEGGYFEGKEYFQAYLVVTGLRAKPFLVRK
jgi:hypothetical protein